MKDALSGQGRDITRTPVPYKFKPLDRTDHVVIWDLPGGGGSFLPATEYTQKLGLRYFNGLFILVGTRWSNVATSCLQAALEWKIPFWIVQTKLDEAIRADTYLHMHQNKGKNDKYDFSKTKTKLYEDRLADLLENMKTCGFNMQQYMVNRSQIFLVCNLLQQDGSLEVEQSDWKRLFESVRQELEKQVVVKNVVQREVNII